MAAFILIACLSIALIALAVRRVLPIAITCFVFWNTQHAGNDLLTTCIAAAAVFALCTMLFDSAAMSAFAVLRFSVRGLEGLAGALVAVFFAWSFAHTFDVTEAMMRPALLAISAALLGGLITVSRYRMA